MLQRLHDMYLGPEPLNWERPCLATGQLTYQFKVVICLLTNKEIEDAYKPFPIAARLYSATPLTRRYSITSGPSNVINAWLHQQNP